MHSVSKDSFPASVSVNLYAGELLSGLLFVLLFGFTIRCDNITSERMYAL